MDGSPDRIIDKTDYPFINDPEIVCKWKSVDAVKEISNFKPGNKGSVFLGKIVNPVKLIGSIQKLK